MGNEIITAVDDIASHNPPQNNGHWILKTQYPGIQHLFVQLLVIKFMNAIIKTNVYGCLCISVHLGELCLIRSPYGNDNITRTMTMLPVYFIEILKHIPCINAADNGFHIFKLISKQNITEPIIKSYTQRTTIYIDINDNSIKNSIARGFLHYHENYRNL